jgi:hypothetical protein
VNTLIRPVSIDTRLLESITLTVSRFDSSTSMCVSRYAYYLLASFGYNPWWKYYITKAQIFQFCCFCVQSIFVGYVQDEASCDFPHILARGLLWYMLSLIALFTHFLVTNTGKKKSAKGNAGLKKKAV